MMKKIMIAYIPVLHAGYMKLFAKYAHELECLYVLGTEFIAEDACIASEIRALSPEISAQVIRGLGLFERVAVLDRAELALHKSFREKVLIVTNDETTREFAEKYLRQEQLVIETQFLRWDRKTVNSGSTISFDRQTQSSFDREMMELARQEGEKTSCWWRRVGGVLVREGEVVMLVHNHHVPSEHAPYAVGDPRDLLQPGVNPELASSMHAEQTLVANAAYQGISLKGMHLYLPVFPCTVCAKLIAYSGISKVFFSTGHASLDGDTILRSRGVELVHVT